MQVAFFNMPEAGFKNEIRPYNYNHIFKIATCCL